MLYILSGSPRLKSRHPRMPERFWDIQHNQHFETLMKSRQILYILSGSPRLKSRHPRMPERFWDIQHNQHFETQLKI